MKLAEYFHLIAALIGIPANIFFIWSASSSFFELNAAHLNPTSFPAVLSLIFIFYISVSILLFIMKIYTNRIKRTKAQRDNNREVLVMLITSFFLWTTIFIVWIEAFYNSPSDWTKLAIVLGSIFGTIATAICGATIFEIVKPYRPTGWKESHQKGLNCILL